MNLYFYLFMIFIYINNNSNNTKNDIVFYEWGGVSELINWN